MHPSSFLRKCTKMKSSKFIAIIALVIAMMMCMSSAMACTTIYVGSDLTAAGYTTLSCVAQ